MVRGKIEMKRIENPTSRQVSFSKRRNGLLKKAYELAILCDAQLALIVFSQKGKLSQFSTSNMEKMIQRYREYAKEEPSCGTDSNMDQEYTEQLKHDIADMQRQIECLEITLRKLTGKNIGSCSIQELQSLDGQLESTLRNIRLKKVQLYQQEIERLKAKERHLLDENAKLHEKMGGRNEELSVKERGMYINCETQSVESWDVDTQLFIGLPPQILYLPTKTYLHHN